MVAGGIDERFISRANDPNESELHSLLWLRSPLYLGSAGHSVKAAALTSLGFGHVSALIVYAHPGVFEQAVSQQRGADAAASRHRTPRPPRLPCFSTTPRASPMTAPTPPPKALVP
ncbi:hypothetical protein [Corynebacterium hiratae]|uniref:Uncharacterized protein n=1 Tax=Corynebacterium aurimucosum TaxID=169292 RepID=A0A6I3KAD6_9CORY|nr:hypothetical protein [Corynebacterium aurimucosum]MTD92365.1 hypothetical protein [Corynebacterium aurimucosum]